MSVNQVVISGNIGKDPELRSSHAGTGILTFSLAVDERVKKNDNWEDYTNWIDCVVFGKRAESLSKILSKGMKVAASGHLHYSTWERDGQKRSKIEVIVEDVDIMQRREQQAQQPYGQQPYQSQGQQQPYQQQYQQQPYQQQYQPQYQQDYEGNF